MKAETLPETPTTEALRREARHLYQRKGEIEIDDGAPVSAAAGGVWVAAWCWVETPAPPSGEGER